MAKVLLGVIASPRKRGNSELFIKELYGQLKGDWQLKLMRLSELDIRPCRACYQCLFGEMKCPIDDDFKMALETLASADAYVVAAPTYLLAANGSLKKFLDRGMSFYAHSDNMWGTPAVGIAIAGIEDMEGITKLNVESFIKLTFGDLRGSDVVYGSFPGEIFLENGGRSAAKRLADALVEKPAKQEFPAGCCNLCGGDTFRFLPDGKIKCMLCSSIGDYEWRDNQLHFRTIDGGRSLFLTYADVLRHADWVRSMKEQFLARRKELKAVTEQFADVGEWVRPNK
ncbi:flavodoxin family protein [Thermodesulfobacteriota bacterium]